MGFGVRCGFRGGGEETKSGGLAEEVAEAGGEDGGGEDVGCGGGRGALGEGGAHLRSVLDGFFLCDCCCWWALGREVCVARTDCGAE